MNRLQWIPFLLFATTLVASQANAVTLIIGDADGFGVAPDGLVSAQGVPVDADGDGILEEGEWLPDLNGDGSVAVRSFDSFDTRSASELAATDGAQWTDYSVEETGAADGATFTFTFAAPVFGDSDYGIDHFINFVFSDYDVEPATLIVDGTVVELVLQSNEGGEDGLIQSAFAVVPWADMADGVVEIMVDAPEEPWLAFDYALLDTDTFADYDEDGVPDGVDNCIEVPNTDQADGDGDGIGDACDLCTDELLDTVVLPYLSPDYRYLQVAYDDEAGFESPAYDDSGWAMGDAGFGSQEGFCPLNNPIDAATPWDINTDLLLRRTFWLPDPSSSLRIGLTIDNDVQVWINGDDLTGELVLHENCPEVDSFIFDVPNHLLVDGYNLIAVRARDRGVLAYVDIQIIGDLCVPGCIDPDADDICEEDDNCRDVENADQADADDDKIGDACDICPTDPTDDESDSDGVCDDVDNCLGVANEDQVDSDDDGAGDACDDCPNDATDDGSDSDGVCDDVDNCLGVANEDQADADDDGAGDACDVCPNDATNDASDSDGACDDVDNCLGVPNGDQYDTDSDGAGDACDVCPGDATDDGSDGDGVCDDVDNCLGLANPDQGDSDGDGIGDACDTCPYDAGNDADGDGVCGDVDVCAGTVIPEARVPMRRLGFARYALVDGDTEFDTGTFRGHRLRRSYSIEDTGGCSCEQIISHQRRGWLNARYGCSVITMERWIRNLP